MEKIIDGKTYYIPGNLTSEQERIYCHIIDWKRSHLTPERGIYKEHEYDAIFPEDNDVPAMLYPPIIKEWRKMQESPFAYKLHKFANHAVSSQTACINLFMPILLSKEADEILPIIPGCPSDFRGIARDKLFRGFCFEYWGQDIKQGKGVLNDHSVQAGTDADIAIAYYNTNKQLCLWLIEHKLTEKEFTECGAYKSNANDHKEQCKTCSMSNLLRNPELCYYTSKGYNYWEIFESRIEKYNCGTSIIGCPFRGGLNQLWRNQLLGFALQKSGIYQNVTFSVCRHAMNTMLNQSIELYKTLIGEYKMFSSFTNYDILAVINSKDLSEWKKWYADVYCI